MADLQRQAKQYDKSEETTKTVLDIAESLLAEDPENRSYRMILGNANRRLGELSRRQKKEQDAIEYFQAELDLLVDLCAEFPDVPMYTKRILEAQQKLRTEFDESLLSRVFRATKQRIMERHVFRDRERCFSIPMHIAYLKREGLEEAAHEFANELREIVDENPEDHHCQELAAWVAICEDDFDVARKQFRSSPFDADYKTNPFVTVHPFAWLDDMGTFLLNCGLYQRASDYYSKMLDVNDPKMYWYIRKRRAETYARLGDFDAALADLELAFEHNPTDGSTVTWIDLSKLDQPVPDDFKDGLISLADRYVASMPEAWAYPKKYRATLMIDLGLWDRAKEDLAIVHEANKEVIYNSYQFGLLCLKLDDREAYLNCCREVIDRVDSSSELVDLHFAIWVPCLVADALDDYDAAISLARECIRRESSNQQYLTGLAAILMRAGKFESALEVAQQTLSADESDSTSAAYSHYFLAMTHFHLNNEESAMAELEKADRLADSEHSPSWNRELTLNLLADEARKLIAD